jgi:hypothetical protein
LLQRRVTRHGGRRGPTWLQPRYLNDLNVLDLS